MIRLRKVVLFSFMFFLVGELFTTPAANALTPGDYASQDIEFYDPTEAGCGSAADGVTTGGPNEDYLGQPILTTAQLAAVQQNEPVYKEAAAEANIPWEMLAAVHLRETGLKVENPTNGQGIYQDSKEVDGPYPPGPVSTTEFLRQSVWAANFIKSKSTDVTGLATGVESAVKDAFYGYNGRADAYAQQAASLGYSQAYEGSPYVMNKADAKRDPVSNPNGWGQIKVDGGPLVYPADGGYGAYVVYASLSGDSTSDCSSSVITGTLRQKIVKYAQQELALWQSGSMKPGFRKNDSTSYTKYTYNIHGDWCAWFVSWILKQSGDPVTGAANPYWSVVGQFVTNAASLGFKVHYRGDGYKPQAGDLAIYGSEDHINIVTGYNSSGAMLTIGGNQPDHSKPGEASNMDTNVVSSNVGYGSTATIYIQVQ